jgi:DNA-binding CsgD family transcriptional regulator
VIRCSPADLGGAPPELDESRRTAVQALERPDARDSSNGFVASLGLLALVDGEHRRHDTAERTAREAISFARQHFEADSWLASLAHLGLALACPASDLKRACAMTEEFSDPGRLPAIAAAVEQDLTAARANVGNGRGVEDPSEAELAVLRCLATGLSRREIGARLYISLNTVKTHNRELYRKLGATSRAEAVARGEALGLLEPTESPG